MPLSSLVLALGCRPQAPEPPPPPPSCGPEVPGLAELIEPGALVVLGEVHGTAEIPAFVGRTACESAFRGVPVAVGLEIPTDEQGRIDAYLRSDGGGGAEARLLEGPFWRREFQDGRASRAVVTLLDTLRGLGIAVVAYDQGTDRVYRVPRDEVMARNLLAARKAAPGRALVALTGNVHARRRSGLPPADVVPMASLLAAEVPSLVTLDEVDAGGSFWACLGARVDDCGIHQARGDGGIGEIGEIGEVGQRVDRTVVRDGFDGVFVVGRISASVPAVRSSPSRTPPTR